MIEDIWRSAKRMERRIEALESILDAEAPGWRKRHDEEGA
jgi:phage shock protein B